MKNLLSKLKVATGAFALGALPVIAQPLDESNISNGRISPKTSLELRIPFQNYERVPNFKEQLAQTAVKNFLDNEDLLSAKEFMRYLSSIDDPQTLALWGQYYFLSGRSGLSKKYLYDSLQRDPNNPNTLNLLAVYHLHFGPENGAELALDYLNRAIRLSPDEPVYYFNRALTFELFMEDFQNALSDFRTAFNLYRDNNRERAKMADHIAGLYFDSTYNEKRLKDSGLTKQELLRESIKWWETELRLLPKDTKEMKIRAIKNRIRISKELLKKFNP